MRCIVWPPYGRRCANFKLPSRGKNARASAGDGGHPGNGIDLHTGGRHPRCQPGEPGATTVRVGFGKLRRRRGAFRTPAARCRSGKERGARPGHLVFLFGLPFRGRQAGRGSGSRSRMRFRKRLAGWPGLRVHVQVQQYGFRRIPGPCGPQGRNVQRRSRDTGRQAFGVFCSAAGQSPCKDCDRLFLCADRSGNRFGRLDIPQEPNCLLRRQERCIQRRGSRRPSPVAAISSSYLDGEVPIGAFNSFPRLDGILHPIARRYDGGGRSAEGRAPSYPFGGTANRRIQVGTTCS